MLDAPHTLPGGQRIWLAGEVAEFTQRLAEFDPSLALYQDPDGSWLIAKISENGETHYIMRSQPDARLGPHVIAKLAEADTRRPGNDPVGDMIRHNDTVTKRADEAADEAVLVALDNVLSKSWRGSVNSTTEDESI